MAIQRATEELQRLDARNVFPEMEAAWRVDPDHIGHLTADGCCRCHDGLHKSPEGQVSTRDCNACHTILAQGPPKALAEARLTEQRFQHPIDLGMDVSELQCSMCHTGTGVL